MKKKLSFLSLFLALGTGLALVSCGGNQSSTPATTATTTGESSSSSSGGDEPTPTVYWEEEDAAHVAQEYKGVANSGTEGINLSGISSAERASLLGDVEAWGLKNHLLGIPLFGDGGWELYSSRVSSPLNKQYVANYGYGILREGRITAAMNATQEPIEAYREYLHLGLSQADGELNPFDSNNSSASNLLGYCQTALYGQRLVKDGNGSYEARFEWYGSLADGEPEPLDWDETTQTATKWKVKVRTGSDANPVTYKTLSTATINGTNVSSFNNVGIKAEDYVNAYRVLMNGKNTYSYATQYITDFVGAQEYYKATSDVKVFSSEDDAAWKKVGIKVLDNNHIEFDFTSSQTKTNAMLNLSTYGPVNEDFFKLVTYWSDDATFEPLNYGTTSTDKTLTPADTLLSTGPYTLKVYSAGTGSDNQIVYERNDDFIERKLENDSQYEVYSIKGVVMNINSNYSGTNGTTAVYNDYMDGKLDHSSIPTDKKSDWEGDHPEKYISGSTAISALQVNSTTEERWDELFGANGTNWENQNDYTYDSAKAATYVHKPILSNYDFLDGLYFCINREELANSLMLSPSSDWLAEAYMVDLDSGVSYINTAAHKRAVQDYLPETYGYSTAVAQAKFKSAMETLVQEGEYTAGTADNPTVISFDLQVMAESQKTRWANAVKNYMETAFNTACNSMGFKLVVNLPNAPTDYNEIYADMAAGCYDVCYGGINGGTGDAFGMTGCWLDSWDYGLQMSVGVSTMQDTGKGGIIYNGYSYSMQGIFYAVEYGSAVIIENGVCTGVATASSDEEDSTENA